MAPKKVEEPEKKPLIGRVGTNLKVGIVGVPNVGKSTFFNVLTKSQAAAENFPFCTIDPNENNGDLNHVKTDIGEETDNRPRPMAVAILGINNTASPLPNNLDSYHTWTDIDSQETYLNLKPMCYTILAKPGTGGYSLGESMAKRLNVIHISPKNVIEDEIEQSSPTGKCIDFNLRHNNICKFDTIWTIMKKKLDSPAIKHRGYVISGLPLVTCSKNMECFYGNFHDEDTVLHAEELVNDLITNVYKKRANVIRNEQPVNLDSSNSSELMSEIESNFEEEEQEAEVNEAMDLVRALPKSVLEPSHGLILFTKAYLYSKKAMLLHQCQEIFSSNVKPNIVIYISCPDTDAVTKRSRKYFNYLSTNPIDSHPFLLKNDETGWPTKYSMLVNLSNFSDNTSLKCKYSCTMPVNFTFNSTNQMCNYKNYIMPYLENKIKDFDSKSVLKLDGRYPNQEMINLLLEKIISLPAKPVLIPEPLYLEDSFDEIEDFWKLAEETNVIKYGSKKFIRYASPWYNRCPVELKKRHVVRGLPKFAVAFFKHIYLLSSLNAMITFCRNPRPFLKLEYLEPTCRIIVMGTKSSGKSMITQCLSWLFDAPVISYESFVNNERQKKYDEFYKSILSKVVTDIEENRKIEWQRKELNRIAKLNDWNDITKKKLQNYVLLIKKYQTFEIDGTKDDKNSDIAGQGSDFFDELANIRNQLSFLPMLDDIQKCQEILENENLFQFASHDLTTSTPKPGVPAIGDEDVMKAITAFILENNVTMDIEPTPLEIMQELIKALKSFDIHVQSESYYEYEYGKYIIDGFPPDSEIWQFLLDSLLLPDYVIVIKENREVDEVIAQNYIDINTCSKSHDTRFLLANDDFIKIKLLSKKVTQTPPINDKMFIKDLINAMMESIFMNKSEFIKKINDSMNKFREDWDTLQLNLKEMFITCIEVQIEDKTDIEIIEEVLLKIRRSYCTIANSSLGEIIESDESEKNASLTTLYDIDPRFLCETNIYCPVSYYKYGVLWKGKSELCLNYDNKLHYFCKEEFLEYFQNDITRYQSYNKPFKKIPPLRICVTGCIGSGKTSVSKLIAKEYGLVHIDFAEILNSYLLPLHCKKVGRHFENSFTDPPIDESTVTGFDLNEENIYPDSSILPNENELRRMIYNYLEKGAPLSPLLMQRLLKKLWFHTPFSAIGFVLDGFPKMASDVEDMTECVCIPDLIFELECSPEISAQRLSTKMLNVWKTHLNDAKAKSLIKLENDRLQWLDFITKNIVVKLIIDDIFDISTIPNERVTNVSTQSAIMDAHPSGSSNVDANLFNTYNNMILEYPEPLDRNNWEKPDDVREKIVTRIEDTYELDDENMQVLKDNLADQNIELISVDGTRSMNKVCKILLSNVASLRRKRETCFEQTFLIDCDVAEVLLLEGFFFLSKFNRMCPVFIFDNPNAIFNPYIVHKTSNNIRTVIHRSHIYFICNEDSLKKFRENPLKYIVNESINYFVEYPLRIAVLGPPKSGKSELTAKLARKYGLLCVSKGIALRHILNNLSWTDLGLKIASKVEKGECVSNDIIILAVQTIINNHCTNSRGFILDGLPTSPFEAMELQKVGLFPLIIFDLHIDRELSLKNLQNEIYTHILKRKPPYSRTFLSYRLLKYSEKCARIRDFVNNDTQNISIINEGKSLWKCFFDADTKIKDISPKIHYYLLHFQSRIIPMESMCISNNDFESKMSEFKHFCPACLRENIFKYSGYSIDKKGVVQFKGRFYWVCCEHMNLVLKYPDRFLEENLDIPEVPAIVKTINKFNLYEDGICIVTYAESLPAHRVERGNEDYAVVYKGKTYLFCSSICFAKFLAKPQMYYDISVFKEGKVLPWLVLKKLPHLGYLEQTVGNIITEACCSVNVARPKYPGLSIQISALLYIALYLKIHNPLSKNSYLPLYTKAIQSFEARSSRVPVPDERFDYLCEFHKPVSKVPAFLNVVDIAGLVRGAAEGQGLGNAFLSHIKACDAIFNLCRAFDDEDVIHVDGDVNPVRDLETIGEELRLKDEEQLMQNIEKLERVVNRGGDKKLKPEYDALLKIKSVLVDEKKHIRFGDWSAAEIEVLNKYLFLTSKPALYLVNLSEKDYIRKKNKWLPKLKEWIDKNDPGAPLIPFSGVLESKLMDMDPAEKQAYLKEHNITSALDKIIVQGYKALQLEYFFTAGPDEVKAWTIQKGTKAPQAAGRIHTDFEKGFIMAEVMHFKDFKEEGTEAACKAAGKYRQQGRNYVVEDGDIIFFKFNAGAGLKDAKKK
ncbi:unnamed protein product [Parnassius apollo]|uniref:(apollo) hypothetical protein n=3 Tax=Papilionidae TaxID=7143 RepID=A0A8S3XCG8_PARAO|nr:unnamed protein product [Parnassius apollo]